MTLQAKQFGSKCTLSEKFINQVILQVDYPKLFTMKVLGFLEYLYMYLQYVQRGISSY